MPDTYRPYTTEALANFTVITEPNPGTPNAESLSTITPSPLMVYTSLTGPVGGAGPRPVPPIGSTPHVIAAVADVPRLSLTQTRLVPIATRPPVPCAIADAPE